uniref:Ribosomal protein L19 n=1 Tax=Halimeda discoidea TaxID=118222 RepID=A0A1C9JB83_9CHLO|nr:ribosomal protein L19 [Halimeda discoidea]
MILEHFDKKKKKNLFVGDSLKVGFGLKEGRIQFFTGTITKISGHKITLSQPGIERIFSYNNPQIFFQNIMAVPKRRSKSRKILWRKKSLKKNRQKREVAMVKLVNTQA